MIRPKARRDFVLDSGGLSYLAESEQRAKAWRLHIATRYDGAAILVPTITLTEALTGDPRRDVKMQRLLNRLTGDSDLDAILLDAALPTVFRAAALRTQAITSGATSTKRPISVADAHLVALAEERSAYNAVTILTTDRMDIQILVDLTGATNIAVQVV